MRGVTETTRGSSYYPVEQSVVVKRNATQQDLEEARQMYVGKIVAPTPQHQQQRPPVYRCTSVRLDGLKRLIFDLVKEPKQQ